MKIYKYDNVTMIAISKKTRDELMKIKHKYHFKNMNELIINMIKEYEYQNEEPYEKYNS